MEGTSSPDPTYPSCHLSCRVSGLQIPACVIGWRAHCSSNVSQVKSASNVATDPHRTCSFQCPTESADSPAMVSQARSTGVRYYPVWCRVPVHCTVCSRQGTAGVEKDTKVACSQCRSPFRYCCECRREQVCECKPKCNGYWTFVPPSHVQNRRD